MNTIQKLIDDLKGFLPSNWQVLYQNSFEVNNLIEMNDRPAAVIYLIQSGNLVDNGEDIREEIKPTIFFLKPAPTIDGCINDTYDNEDIIQECLEQALEWYHHIKNSSDWTLINGDSKIPTHRVYDTFDVNVTGIGIELQMIDNQGYCFGWVRPIPPTPPIPPVPEYFELSVSDLANSYIPVGSSTYVPLTNALPVEDTFDLTVEVTNGNLLYQIDDEDEWTSLTSNAYFEDITSIRLKGISEGDSSNGAGIRFSSTSPTPIKATGRLEWITRNGEYDNIVRDYEYKHIFYNLQNLVDASGIDCSHWDTLGVESLYGMFRKCSSLMAFPSMTIEEMTSSSISYFFWMSDTTFTILNAPAGTNYTTAFFKNNSTLQFIQDQSKTIPDSNISFNFSYITSSSNISRLDNVCFFSTTAHYSGNLESDVDVRTIYYNSNVNLTLKCNASLTSSTYPMLKLMTFSTTFKNLTVNIDFPNIRPSNETYYGRIAYIIQHSYWNYRNKTVTINSNIFNKGLSVIETETFNYNIVDANAPTIYATDTYDIIYNNVKIVDNDHKINLNLISAPNFNYSINPSTSGSFVKDTTGYPFNLKLFPGISNYSIFKQVGAGKIITNSSEKTLFYPSNEEADYENILYWNNLWTKVPY